LSHKEDWVENAKKKAALKAIEHVKDTFIIGLGSGSTAAYAIEELGKKVEREQLHILAVPTSYQAFKLAVQTGIQITTLDEHPTLDLTIDGADQIDQNLNLIKGMGGALTREKIVASASRKLIIIADESKKVKFLGENNHPVPLEVIKFAATPVTHKIEEIGGKPTLREGKGKVGPIISDDGNFIIDACFGAIHEPAELETKLKSIPGVVETGLFVRMANMIYLGTRSNVEKIEK
jgi:ribose 5-phosphate isomerase A